MTRFVANGSSGAGVCSRFVEVLCRCFQVYVDVGLKNKCTGLLHLGVILSIYEY